MQYAVKMGLAALLLAPWGMTQAVTLNDDFSLDLNIGAYSDYRSRGQSQTQNDPALQGSATLSHSSGLYAGLWSSNVDFGYDTTTRQEIDYYLGYFWQINDDVSLDLAYYKYEYPNQAGFNYNETYARLSAYGAYIGGYYSDNFGGEDSYLYSYVGYETSLPMDIGLDLRFGLADYKDPVWVDDDGDDRDSYHEWQVGLSKTLLELDWSLSYVDTDLSDEECYNYNGFDDVCDATLVLGVSKSF